MKTVKFEKNGEDNHRNKQNKQKYKSKKHRNLFSKILPIITAGVMAITPKLAKAQTTDEFEWRSFWYIIDIDETPVEFDSLRWAFKKNGLPINDTTYTITQAGTTYVCGIYADTVVSEPDSTEAWVVTYEYIEQPYSDLVRRSATGITFEGDSVEQCSTWVHVTNIRYTYPGFVLIGTEQNTYYQQYEDGSVHDNAYSWVGYCSSPVKEKSYMVDNNVYSFSIPLDIREEINKPQVINMRVYPNPANLYFNIKLSTKSNGTVTLYDMNGKIIDKKLINNNDNVKINASNININSGNFIIVFESENGTKVSKRIILVK